MKQSDTRIKIVVVNENTIGLQRPNSNSLDVLQASVLKGATFRYLPEPLHINSSDKVRLANENDFHEYRIEFTQYASRPDEYEIQR